MADHKDHSNRWADEFEIVGEADPPVSFFGFYTSAANTVYVPTSFLKPTDFNNTMRTMMQRKAEDLYGSFCNIAPPPLTVRTDNSSAWEIDQFSWGEPVGTGENVADFSEYRSRIIDNLLASRPT